MRPPALLFLAILVAAAAAWPLLVLPVDGKAAELATRLQKEDIGARTKAAMDPAPTADQARLLEEHLAALRPGSATLAPRGMTVEGPGTFGGRLRWAEVQGLLAWVAEQPLPLLELEVKALADDPARVACRVVFGR